MSWHKLNNFELQAVRKSLGMDVSDCAKCIADLTGKHPQRSWQRWEKGDSPVPDDIDMEMYAFAQWKGELIDETLDEIIPLSKDIAMRWFHTVDDFLSVFPDSNEATWRLHQSVMAELFTMGYINELSDQVTINEDSYIYKFFSGALNKEFNDAEKAFEERLNKNKEAFE